MRLGFLPVLAASAGGVHQYSLAVLEAVASRLDGDDHVVFTSEHRDPAVVALRERGWEVRPLHARAFDRWSHALVRRAYGPILRPETVEAARRRLGRTRVALGPVGGDLDAIRKRPEMGAWFRRCGVELMVYPAPHPLAFESGVPYVMAVHDLQHRLQPHFPEVSAGGEWEQREYLFRHGIGRATLVVADSEVGREDVLSLYGADEERVHVLPFPPPAAAAVSAEETARVRERYELPAVYGFYPAQFWPHKNHERIVRAVARARDQGVEICVAFSGSHDGEIREHRHAELRRLVAELGLERRVRFLGYVPAADVPPLYAGARALVMPTFFGPTNIPVLEAWQLGCAVLSSDIRGIREQVGDAGLLVDPESVEALADALVRLWTDDRLRAELVARGAARVAAYTFDDFADRLREILDEAKARVAAGDPTAAAS